VLLKNTNLMLLLLTQLIENHDNQVQVMVEDQDKDFELNQVKQDNLPMQTKTNKFFLFYLKEIFKSTLT
jgi:hypothetical protein